MAAAQLATWDDVILAVLEMVRLRDDWDGQGALAPPLMACLRAIRDASWRHRTLQPVPLAVLAGVNGSVFFEWHSPTGYAEVEFTVDGSETRTVKKDCYDPVA